VTELARALVAHLREVGTIGFDEYVAHALYAPGLGFYAAGGGAGRRHDFLTSPEVGPLYGAVWARVLDGWWDELGRPARYPVVEAGAGPGTLARTILAARPRCLDALELVLVEPAEARWATHPTGVASRVDLPAPGELGAGPIPVIANELLDNLPFALVERTAAGWCEVRVGLADAGGGRSTPGDGPQPGVGDERADRDGVPLVEVLVPLDADRARWCTERAGADAPVGARLPVQAEAAAWVGEARALAVGGPVVVVDYADRSSSLARRPWRDWVRTYAAHGRAGHPLEAPGSCDITCEVAIDQLGLAAPIVEELDQATFLRRHGLDELVAEGRARWAELGLGGGVEALTYRSRVTEADALTDPAGLGAFTVLRW
jgi:SAM-dependent MidA family methyltransferase